MPHRRAPRPSPHAVLRWEALGHSVTGLEQLETRVALAADLAIAFVGSQASHTWYQPGTTEIFQVEVTNLGPDPATAATVTASLGSQISRQTWTAAFSSGSSGTFSGSGPLNTSVTLPSGGKVTYTITARIGEGSSGTMASTATATIAGDPVAGNNTVSRSLAFAPRFAVVTDGFGGSSPSLVRIVDPQTGAVTASFPPFGTGSNGGIQAAIGDFDGTNRPMVAVASGRGLPTQLRVFARGDDGTWRERTEFRTSPFAGSTRGATLTVGDVNADGRDDFALGDAGGSEVKVFLTRQPTAGNPRPVERTPFRTLTNPGVGGGIAFANLATFVDGRLTDATRRDGRAELLLASGAGVAPEVRVVDLSGPAPIVADSIEPGVGRDRTGLTVTTATVTADGIPDIAITGGGTRPATEIYDGSLGAGGSRRLATFAAFGSVGRPTAPATLTALDTDGDGRDDVLFAAQAFRGAAGVKTLATAGLATGSVGAFGMLGRFGGAANVAARAAAANPAITTSASGLESAVLATGPTTGTSATTGRTLRVNYTGRLLDGTKFDSSLDPGRQPFEFTLGRGQVIRGWDEGLVGRRAGDRLQLVIPAALGYGATGQGSIPPNATLVFDIEVVSVT